MRIPKGMTAESVEAQINIVVNRIAPAYTFYGYDVNDVKQESWIICIKAMDRFKDGYRLENFLSHNLANRLKTLIRDNHYNKDSTDDKKKVVMPGQLSNEECTHFYNTDMLDKLDMAELKDIMDREIPYEYRGHYIKLLGGTHVAKKDKEELIEVIQQIAEDYGYTDE